MKRALMIITALCFGTLSAGGFGAATTAPKTETPAAQNTAGTVDVYISYASLGMLKENVHLEDNIGYWIVPNELVLNPFPGNVPVSEKTTEVEMILSPDVEKIRESEDGKGLVLSVSEEAIPDPAFESRPDFEPALKESVPVVTIPGMNVAIAVEKETLKAEGEPTLAFYSIPIGFDTKVGWHFRGKPANIQTLGLAAGGLESPSPPASAPAVAPPVAAPAAVTPPVFAPATIIPKQPSLFERLRSLLPFGPSIKPQEEPTATILPEPGTPTEGGGITTTGKLEKQTTDYIYDGLGRLVRRDNSAKPSLAPVKYWTYFGPLRMVESFGDSVGHTRTTLEFFHGIDGPQYIVFTKTGDGASSATGMGLHKDHLGSTIALTDEATGNVLYRYYYDPFGQPFVQTPPGSPPPSDIIFNPILYTGHYYDGNAEAYLTPFRAYDPALGRFMQRDPLGFPDGPNTYAYVNNSPYAFTDPWGLVTKGEKEVKGPTPLPPGFTNPTGREPFYLTELIHWTEQTRADSQGGFGGGNPFGLSREAYSKYPLAQEADAFYKKARRFAGTLFIRRKPEEMRALQEEYEKVKRDLYVADEFPAALGRALQKASQNREIIEERVSLVPVSKEVLREFSDRKTEDEASRKLLRHYHAGGAFGLFVADRLRGDVERKLRVKAEHAEIPTFEEFLLDLTRIQSYGK